MTEEELMLTSLHNCRRIDLYVDPKPLNDSKQRKFNQMKLRRQGNEPLQYILGKCEFMGLDFYVDSRVLIPRPETEILVSLAIEKAKSLNKSSLNILDLCTGSGNIAVSIAKFLPNCHVVAIDSSSDALNVAIKNAFINSVEDRISFQQKDALRCLNDDEEGGQLFDLILTNPPYIASSQINKLPLDVQQEPLTALDGGSDGADFYRHFFKHVGEFLNPQGYFIGEIGDDQKELLVAELEGIECPMNLEGFVKDYSAADRIIVLRKKA